MCACIRRWDVSGSVSDAADAMQIRGVLSGRFLSPARARGRIGPRTWATAAGGSASGATASACRSPAGRRTADTAKERRGVSGLAMRDGKLEPGEEDNPHGGSQGKEGCATASAAVPRRLPRLPARRRGGALPGLDGPRAAARGEVGQRDLVGRRACNPKARTGREAAAGAAHRVELVLHLLREEHCGCAWGGRVRPRPNWTSRTNRLWRTWEAAEPGEQVGRHRLLLAGLDVRAQSAYVKHLLWAGKSLSASYPCLGPDERAGATSRGAPGGCRTAAARCPPLPDTPGCPHPTRTPTSESPQPPPGPSSWPGWGAGSIR